MIMFHYTNIVSFHYFAGQPQTYTDFTASSRYWRLELIDNYGGNCICIHGIKLFGADERIRTVLEENMLDNYADDVIGLVCMVKLLKRSFLNLEHSKQC